MIESVPIPSPSAAPGLPCHVLLTASWCLLFKPSTLINAASTHAPGYRVIHRSRALKQTGPPSAPAIACQQLSSQGVVSQLPLKISCLLIEEHNRCVLIVIARPAWTNDTQVSVPIFHLVLRLSFVHCCVPHVSGPLDFLGCPLFCFPSPFGSPRITDTTYPAFYVEFWDSNSGPPAGGLLLAFLWYKT